MIHFHCNRNMSNKAWLVNFIKEFPCLPKPLTLNTQHMFFIYLLKLQQLKDGLKPTSG